MEVKYLDCEELAIECQVRNITGNITQKMGKLQDVLEKETLNVLESPKRAHPAALKDPKREIKLCSGKLKDIENQLQTFSGHHNVETDKILELKTRVVHVGDRLERINTSRTVAIISSKMIAACQKLLTCLEDIRVEKTVSDNVENSLKQVFEEIVGDPLTEEYESADEVVVTSKAAIPQPGTSKEFNNTEHSESGKQNSELTDDERMDLIADKICKKLGLTGSLATNQRKTVQETVFEQDSNKRASSPNLQLPDNFNPMLPPPFYGTTSNRHTLSTLPPTSNVRMPKQYLEIYNWKLVYHGDEKDEIPIERFLYRVQRMASENGLSKERLAANFSVLLKERALNWYWEHQETYGVVAWEELCEAMIQRFKTRRTDEDVRQAMERRKQKFREPFLDFYHSLRSMALSLLKPMLDNELINLICRNMRGGLQAKFAGLQFSSIAEMVSQCVSVEDTWNRLGWTPEIYHQVKMRQVNELDVIGEDECDDTSGYYNAEQPRHFSSVCAVSASRDFSTKYVNKQTNPIFQKSLSPNACWNCFSIGHFYKDCAIPIRHRFCFGCGIPDILKTQCTRCKNLPKGNAMRDFRNPGTLNSRAPTSLPPRKMQEEVATNTDPELYKAILKRDTNPRID